MDLSSVKYLSFDCYGTLVDWETGILDVFANDLNQFSSVSESHVLQSFAKWEAEFEADTFLNYEQVLTQVYAAMCDEFSISNRDPQKLSNSVGHWRPFPDTANALQTLKEKFGLAVLSNVDSQMFASTQKQIGIEFDLVCTSQEIGSYKPSLENFEYLINRLECQNSEILHVAQSVYHDHVPASKMNINSIWVDRPSRLPGTGATLSTAFVPETRVTSMNELVEWIHSSH